jgi:hypothetical protein
MMAPTTRELVVLDFKSKKRVPKYLASLQAGNA